MLYFLINKTLSVTSGNKMPQMQSVKLSAKHMYIFNELKKIYIVDGVVKHKLPHKRITILLLLNRFVPQALGEQHIALLHHSSRVHGSFTSLSL